MERRMQMRVRSLAKRILMQLRNDKRTLALMLVAPLLILTLIYFVFEGMVTTVSIGVLNAPEKYVDNLYEQNTKPIRYLDEKEAFSDMKKGALIAIVDMESGKITAWVDGSNSTDAGKALKAIEAAKIRNTANRTDLNSDIRYVYGSEDLSQFDNFAAVLIGFLVFFLVFLISGISFIRERTTGTLEKMLSTPIKRWELVSGYVLGFGPCKCVAIPHYLHLCGVCVECINGRIYLAGTTHYLINGYYSSYIGNAFVNRR